MDEKKEKKRLKKLAKNQAEIVRTNYTIAAIAFGVILILLVVLGLQKLPNS